jgi:3-oxoacyl-[acyl-carrier protein] reductase
MPVLAGKVALVTGGSRGIGRAIALRLASEGAAVAIAYRERLVAAEQVACEIESEGGSATALQADLALPAACRQLVAATTARLGAPDVLVNNAGTSLARLILDTQVEEWDHLMALHLRAPFLLSQAALPPMIRRGWGRIITISSIWGLVGAANEVAYSVAKSGQIGFTRALAKELARAGITVNAVAPGAVNTEMLSSVSSGLSSGDLEEFAASVPMGRLGTPEEVAAAVAFLASPGAGYITGQVISPNGGLVV